MNAKGFSLVELLVVVAIIGILASVGVVIYNNFIHNSRVAATSLSYNQTAKKIHTEYDAITGDINVPSMFIKDDDPASLTCGEYMNSIRNFYITSNVPNFFQSDLPLILCADDDIQTIGSGECSCDPCEEDPETEMIECFGCIDTVTEASVPPGAILLVCLDGDHKAFKDNFGMQVILNNEN